MGIFNKTIDKVLETGAKVTDKIIGNSKNANQLDARTHNKGDGFLDQNIHEIMALLIFFSVILADFIKVPLDIRKDLMLYLGMVVTFLFSKGRR